MKTLIYSSFVMCSFRSTNHWKFTEVKLSLVHVMKIGLIKYFSSPRCSCSKSGEVYIYIYIYLRFTNTHHLQSQLQKIKPGKQTLRQRKPSWCSDRNWSICDTTGVVPNCWMLRPAVLKAINGLLGVFSKGRTCQSCCPRVHLIGLSFTQSHWFIPIQQHHRLD